MKKESQVLIKIHANPFPERTTTFPQWDGPKIFEERLVSPDEAEKLKDEWVRLGDFMGKDDIIKYICTDCLKTLASKLCRGCKKYNHICNHCIDTLCDKCNQTETCGDNIDVLPNFPCGDTLGLFPVLYYNAMKFEIITDAKIIEAFKIVNPKGYVRSYPILDEISSAIDNNKSSSSVTKNSESTNSTTSGSESSSSIAEIHVCSCFDLSHESRPFYQEPEGVIYSNILGSPTAFERHLYSYPNPTHKTLPLYRDNSGVIYATINDQIIAIGFDVEKDGKIKMPTSFQKSLLMKDFPLNVKWRNGNNNPVSCDEYLKMTGSNESSSSATSDSESSSSTTSGNESLEIQVHYYPNPPHESLKFYRTPKGVIYTTINDPSKPIAIGFDDVNNGKIKMPTSFQKSLLRKDVPLDVKWRNGNNNPVSCDEYMKMTNRNEYSSSTTSDSEIHVQRYPNPPHESHDFYRSDTGVIYTTINNQAAAIGFDVENDGKIKMPTASQISFLRKDVPLDVKWRNGNHDPMSCDEYLKTTTTNK